MTCDNTILEIKAFLENKKKVQLLKLIEEVNYANFFSEIKEIGKQNHEIIKLGKEFMHDGGKYNFPEKLKIWVLHNFQ